MATAHDPGAVRQVHMLFYSLVASVLLLSVLYVLLTLASDIANAWLDPRIRVS